MEIFLAWFEVYDEMGLPLYLGAYSTRELAEEAIQRHEAKYLLISHDSNLPSNEGEYSIDVSTVDVDGF